MLLLDVERSPPPGFLPNPNELMSVPSDPDGNVLDRSGVVGTNCQHFTHLNGPDGMRSSPDRLSENAAWNLDDTFFGVKITLLRSHLVAAAAANLAPDLAGVKTASLDTREVVDQSKMVDEGIVISGPRSVTYET